MHCTERARGRQILIRAASWQHWVLLCHGELVTVSSRWQTKCKKLQAAIQIDLSEILFCSSSGACALFYQGALHRAKHSSSWCDTLLYLFRSELHPQQQEQLHFSSRAFTASPPRLRAEGLTFCPGYKIRHGMKSSCKYPRVRRTRLQLQHLSKERTCNADVNEPDQGPSSQGRGKFCPPCMLEYVATPNTSLLLPPAFHQLPSQKHCLTFPEAVFLATPSARAQVWVPIPLLLKIPSPRRRILLIKSREL